MDGNLQESGNAHGREEISVRAETKFRPYGNSFPYGRKKRDSLFRHTLRPLSGSRMLFHPYLPKENDMPVMTFIRVLSIGMNCGFSRLTSKSVATKKLKPRGETFNAMPKRL